MRRHHTIFLNLFGVGAHSSLVRKYFVKPGLVVRKRDVQIEANQEQEVELQPVELLQFYAPDRSPVPVAVEEVVAELVCQHHGDDQESLYVRGCDFQEYGPGFLSGC